ncbi:hypothetical protein ACFQ3R_09825 [Mesonia ostreae]|uniref:Outer membrane protein beta-barrel domain-containing protein n=1 Tax=Mesonia ostreae TaxID=861110 RepID=A0ABU2KEA3_9FLAO|nr:hypothetical protein [Mesonia ostreae]MDT0293036.1 hypothetical protein [Mesonia ostreae]
MKKILLFSAFVFLGLTSATAQLQEGNVMLGADLGNGLLNKSSSGIFGFNFGLNDGAGYSVGINPKVGYFVKDNFMLGGIVNLGFSKSAENNGVSTKATSYGVQALSRYYLTPNEAGVNLTKKGRFFLEANAGFAGVNIKDGPTTNGFVFGAGPGYSYFLNNHVALEGIIKYNGLVGGGNTTYQHSIGLNVGVQVFLFSDTVKNKVDRYEEEIEDEMD